MLTVKSILRTTRQMSAYGELRGPPVPRDRGPSPAARPRPEEPKPLAPGERRKVRRWNEEKGAHLLVEEVGPDAPQAALER